MEFDAAAATYDAARQAYYQAQTSMAEAKAELAALREQMQDIEAAVVADGGAAGVTIDGKNAETRSAQLRVILQGREDYVAVRHDMAVLEKAVALADADADDAANRMSLARRVMDHLIAVTNRAAATEAGAGVERGSHVQ